MIETATFTCSICSEPSIDICVWCTKDACPNHRCCRCLRCSDCCDCDEPLSPEEPDTIPHEAAPMPSEAPDGSATTEELKVTVEEEKTEEDLQSPGPLPESDPLQSS